MGLLWPESDPDRASNSLRQTIYQLRRDLGEEVFLPEAGGGIQLDPAHVEVDLWAFRDAMDADAPAEAVELYDGPFLDGFRMPDTPDLSQWVDTWQSRLEREHVAALDELARRAEEEGRYREAVSWRRRQAAADPFSSRTALALLRALAAAGDRPGALEYARTYENLVRLHLEAEPDPVVAAFVESLRKGGSEGAGLGGSRKRTSSRPEGEPASREVEESAALEDEPSVAGDTEGGRRPVPAGRWYLGAVALAVLVVAGWWWMMEGKAGDVPPPPGPTMVVLASAANPVDGRDPATRLVACEGPACPEGDLPQQAHVVVRHSAYAAPVAGSGFIAPVADATTRPPPGYECCTTAIFESEFRLPPDARSARISLSVIADNRATVAINGVEFGGHDDAAGAASYAGPVSTFSTVFPPHPSGTNRLRLTLWNEGGAVGLQYHGTVTWEEADLAENGG